MTTPMNLDEWLEANILTDRQDFKGRANHDTEPPVSRPQKRPAQKKLTRTIRRVDREIAARRARMERERMRERNGLYPSDS